MNIWGAEGSARFDFDVDKDGNPINIRLRTTSGDAEIDRKPKKRFAVADMKLRKLGFKGNAFELLLSEKGQSFSAKAAIVGSRRLHSRQNANRSVQPKSNKNENAYSERLSKSVRLPAAVEPARPP
ncbi:MAG: hypothetical protein HC936_13080 [Leptolyngbyaceae cyanobacterium SU_3_3]|nr:hypothetical protein [Leptolyngbyaceae cyanobacterium SU_3_3]